jgi:hypothetical protein
VADVGEEEGLCPIDLRKGFGASPLLLVNGRVAWREGAPSAELGRERGFGRLLRAR